LKHQLVLVKLENFICKAGNFVLMDIFIEYCHYNFVGKSFGDVRRQSPGVAKQHHDGESSSSLDGRYLVITGYSCRLRGWHDCFVRRRDHAFDKLAQGWRWRLPHPGSLLLKGRRGRKTFQRHDPTSEGL